MATEYATVEVWVTVNECGDYEVGADQAAADELDDVAAMLERACDNGWVPKDEREGFRERVAVARDHARWLRGIGEGG